MMSSALSSSDSPFVVRSSSLVVDMLTRFLARRRVALGFVFAIAVVYFAQPTTTLRDATMMPMAMIVEPT